MVAGLHVQAVNSLDGFEVYGEIFEGAVVGRWNVLTRQTNGTGIEVVETVLRNQGKELSTNSAGFHALFHHNHAVSLPNRSTNRVHTQRFQADQINQLNTHAIGF